MNRPTTIELTLVWNDAIEWINGADVFWLKDFYAHFEVKERTPEFNKLKYLIQVLKKENYLQCCENKGSFKQYILVKKIPKF